MRLYRRNIRQLEPGAAALLPPARQARIARCRDAEEALRLTAAGLLLRERLGVTQDGLLRTGPYGKPYLPGGPEFSLSHGGELAVLLLADAPCGVDVERCGREPAAAMRSRVLTAAEQASGRPFAWLWTRKEAALKLDGRGLVLPFPEFSVLDDELVLNGRHILLRTERREDHFISCAVAAGIQDR